MHTPPPRKATDNRPTGAPDHANRSDGKSPFARDTRAVSEVVGYALLIGIVITSATVLLLVGGEDLDRSQTEIEIAQAEHSLSQLDSQASRVALGDDPVQRVDLGMRENRGSLATDPDSGWIRVSRVNTTTDDRELIANTSLGAVVYENGDTTVAYQGGGVWRSDGDGSVMVSRPEFHFRNDTLSMPLIATRGDGGIHSEVEVTPHGPSNQAYPDESKGWTNKVNDSVIEITVQSEYHEAWKRYFESDMDGIADVDHDPDEGTVTVRFLAIPTEFSPRSGVIATAGPGNLELEGTDARIDSYNSTEDPWIDSNTDEGEVEAAGDVIVSGDASIEGNVRSGGSVTVPNNAGWIEGDVGWTEGPFEYDDRIGGDDYQIDGVFPVPPIDDYVTENVREVRANNSNDDTDGLIEDDQLQGGGTLDEGEYYFENLHVEGEKLVLDTSDGDITIAVQEWVKVVSQGNQDGVIEVKGDGNVEVYVEGDDEVEISPVRHGPEEVNLFVGQDSRVFVPDQRSTQLTVFAQQDFYANLAGSGGTEPGDDDRTRFEGTIYAPAGDVGSGEVYIMHASLYGAVVTGDLTLGNRGAVHFDHALRDEYLPLSPTVSRLEYLYVTVHEIEVSGA